jgi:hypothetical protein
MTQDEIIEMAKQAEFINLDLCSSELIRFAKLVAERAVRESSAEYRLGWNDGQISEREACAEIAEKQRYAMNISLTSHPAQNGTAVGIANEIRLRGQG